MTKEKFMTMFGLFSYLVAGGHEGVFYFAPSAHLIDHCGGYELELHPSVLMWEHDLICLCAMAEKLCLAVECRFHEGSIIIRQVMCKVVQLSLNFSPINFGAELDTLQELDAAAKRQGLESCFIDPCKGCDLAVVCGHDDCAHHLFDLDSPEPPSGSWEDWLNDYLD